MAFQRSLPQFYDPLELVSIDAPPDVEVILHRYPGGPGLPHNEDGSCWCSPMVTTVGDLALWHPGALQRRLERFLCVH
jgi:hypothetical protein